MANRIKKGDQVVVTTGKDKGKKGDVVRVAGDKVVVSNVNIIKRHTNSRSDSNFKRKCFSASCILISKRIFIDSRKY